MRHHAATAINSDFGAVVWLTGLPRAGKSTLAAHARDALARAGACPVVLDGDEVRRALVPSPGYDPDGRDAFYATLANLAALLARQGHIVLVPATAHRRRYREVARALAPRFVEVHVDTPLDGCLAQDPAGLYHDDAVAHALPGAGVGYEPPERADVIAHGGCDVLAVEHLLALLLPAH